MSGLVATVRGLLQGEPLRMITYGAIAVVIVVSRVLAMTGLWPDAPSVDMVLAAVAAAVAAVNEVIRQFVYSPASAAALAAAPAATQNGG